MSLANADLLLICLGFFVIATLYSSIGFGGGSSYLALLTLFFVSFFTIRSSGLICNLIVVSGSTFLYYKNGYFNLKKFLPFIITSIPLAFLGATFRLKEEVFFSILGVALVFSAIFLTWQTLNDKNTDEKIKKYPAFFPYLIGGAIGLLSGLVGIGGGIFLAPVLNHLKWDKSITIAALASFFILVNSVSGLGGLISNNTLEIPLPEILFLAVAVFLGGQLGIRLSLKKLTGKSIKLFTAMLVFIVGMRVLIVNGIQFF
ncbi:sulfite exporter TauE/SafE family protein [Gramella sp. AN32]|uniref:Probable membrane transporter protein n=1 Tax=Christiangramia antarctica TaxID=2058158 RepID=A0ABW5X9R9_9FLAO|nr:sulfite exporter TauE/SafE family protein [Gramella sp. AN32]MCM4156208.1 sulfite exporter TauE/SafE family protein [Gramella sp. AN32]